MKPAERMQLLTEMETTILAPGFSFTSLTERIVEGRLTAGMFWASKSAGMQVSGKETVDCPRAAAAAAAV